MYILEKLHTLIDGLKKYVLFKQFSVLRSGVGAWGMVGDFYPFLFLRPPHLLNIICHIYIKISIFHVLKKELLFHNSSRREFSAISLTHQLAHRSLGGDKEGRGQRVVSEGGRTTGFLAHVAH